MSKRKGQFKGVTPATDRHGKMRWRLRRTIKGRKIDTYIHGVYGGDQFRSEYEAAIAGPDKTAVKASAGTVDHLIETYYRHRDWAALRQSTKAPKRARLDNIRMLIGKFRYADIEPKHIQNLMDRKGGPNAANRLHKDLHQLFKFARKALGYNGPDPTEAVDRIKVKSSGFHTWAAEQVKQFREHHPHGSKARLAFEIALGTGAARQDVARMGPMNVKGGAIWYVRGKTGGRVILPLALLPELAKEIALCDRGAPTFVTHGNGKPYSVAAFGNWFRDKIKEAGLPDECGLHGLRKYGAKRLAEHGATEFQIAAFLGHETTHEARRYVAAANRVTMASDALSLLQDDENLSNLEGGLGKNTPQHLEKKG